jgi:hypothetical protein
MYVNPETYHVVSVGQTFTINITVAEVADLWGWVFQLFYSSQSLNGTVLEEGPFLKTAGETFFWEVNFTDNYDATHGFVYAFCHLTHVMPGANGNGTIAIITFKSMAPGTSVLHLTETKLKNSGGDYISHETRDGSVTIGKPGDLDGDGDVDGWDASLFREAYIFEYNPLADFDKDGDVDGLDASKFRNYYLYDP